MKALSQLVLSPPEDGQRRSLRNVVYILYPDIRHSFKTNFPFRFVLLRLCKGDVFLSAFSEFRRS
jgi:hypothetical protein